MKPPLEQAIQRAALVLANIHAARRETIPRAEQAKAIKQEEHFAIMMGMSSEDFRRELVQRTILRMQTGDHGSIGRSERHELETTLVRVLGGVQ